MPIAAPAAQDRVAPHLSEDRPIVGPMETAPADDRSVFVVHGRNLTARDGLFTFLRSLGLKPMEWSQAVALTAKGSPYIGEVLDAAFSAAQAVVVLMTPDEVAYLRPEYGSPGDPETDAAAQARPNVLFEAGMAIGRHPDRTILVEHGMVRPFSDVAGRHAVRLDNSPERRTELAGRLKTAGCAVDRTGTDWLTAGDLTAPPVPGGGLPLGRRVPTAGREAGPLVDARYHDRGKSSGRLEIINRSGLDLFDVNVELPEESQGLQLMGDLPIKKLPAHRSVHLPAARGWGGGASHFEIEVAGRDETGQTFVETPFVDLMG